MTHSFRNDLPANLRESIGPRDGQTGIEKPKAFLDFVTEKPEELLYLAQRHIISAKQFTKELVIQLCRLSAHFEVYPTLFHRPLQGKILISAFYEPSTRTRLSFESSWHRLGGDIMSITDRSTTGIAKGESLEDIGEMFNNYGDVVVLRDNSDDSVTRMSEKLRIPIINAGNGTDEHPTQALSDIYAILKWRPDLTLKNLPEKDKVRIGIIGTPGRMRTVRSLMILLSLFSSSISEVVVINPEEDPFADGQKEELEQSGLKIVKTNSLKEILPSLDIIYINSIAWVGESFETLTGDIKLSKKLPIKESAIILHPLARGDELDKDLDDTPHNWYFAQARGAVFLRMALLTCLVQRTSLVTDMSDPNLEPNPLKREIL
ncbi:aspartate/ornithine carbamoyltransferase family protein [Leptospira sp. GIMC2001]|uniref:aspartate/ornithine carbamoyltransferase family protein n=1 Tax=Leptospira sp. GIMC2001 TaxID=1513297 RepID=UPI00234BDBA9|nr:aspartate carbamoyltransferase [Leptospira sp. GIMC2001]WCL50837.1 aspartate carbamoyltransferase [Leptospira sp. GIMC2001]